MAWTHEEAGRRLGILRREEALGLGYSAGLEYGQSVLGTLLATSTLTWPDAVEFAWEELFQGMGPGCPIGSILRQIWRPDRGLFTAALADGMIRRGCAQDQVPGRYPAATYLDVLFMAVRNLTRTWPNYDRGVARMARSEKELPDGYAPGSEWGIVPAGAGVDLGYYGLWPSVGEQVLHMTFLAQRREFLDMRVHLCKSVGKGDFSPASVPFTEAVLSLPAPFKNEIFTMGAKLAAERDAGEINRFSPRWPLVVGEAAVDILESFCSTREGALALAKTVSRKSVQGRDLIRFLGYWKAPGWEGADRIVETAIERAGKIGIARAVKAEGVSPEEPVL
jgi:hypothetical protein